MSDTFRVGEHPIPFRHSQDTAKALASILALIPQLMLYEKLGLRLVSKARIIGLAVFLLGASWFGNILLSFSLFGGFHAASGNDESLRLLLFSSFSLWVGGRTASA